MNSFLRAILLVCVALSLGACSADHLSRMEPPALAVADEVAAENIDGTEPVVFNTISGQCHRLDPPTYSHGVGPPVFVRTGKPHRVQLDGTACIPGMRIVTDMALPPANG